jgi:hypothetical protein
MKNHTSLTVFGAGQSNIPLSLAGSIANLPSSTTSPVMICHLPRVQQVGLGSFFILFHTCFIERFTMRFTLSLFHQFHISFHFHSTTTSPFHLMTSSLLLYLVLYTGL